MKVAYSFFPKMLAHLSAGEVGEFAAKCGFDAVNAVIRPGYWVDPDDVAHTIGRFVSAVSAEGVGAHFATTGWDPSSFLALPNRDEVISACLDAGVRDLRLAQYFSGGGYGKVGDVKSELSRARDELAELAELGVGSGLRFVYQLHHKTLISSPSAIEPLVRGLDPAGLSVMLDAGNQALEGYESWMKASRLLGPHVAAFGVKDVAYEAADTAPRWSARFCPVTRGITDWNEVFDALADCDFDGTFVSMPFYGIDDPSKLQEILVQELTYLRELEAGRKGS
jgi:sugar phosphate isomerase/epimerase